MGSAVASLICADVFPGSLNSKSNTDIVIAMIVADAVNLTQSGLRDTDSQSVNRTTIFSLSQTNFGTITRMTDKSLLLKCVTTIPCIDHADLLMNISD